MPILALDTSIGPASIALLDDDGTILAMAEDTEALKQSQRLVETADRLVRGTLGGYSSLRAIIAGIGPGGFTGIRIALAAARGFGLAAGKPVIGISTLESYAWQRLADASLGSRALAIVDAYRGQAYAQPFERTAHGLHPLAEAQAVDDTALDAYAAAWPDATLIGNPRPDMPLLQRQAFPHTRHAGAFAAFLLRNTLPEALAAERHAEAFYIRPPDAKPQAPFLQPSQEKP